MNSQDVKKKIAKLPDAPGVYFFVQGKKILYIGKATSLRDRVRSYFAGNIGETRGPLIAEMLTQFDDIKFTKTDSVLEALILEANLIRKHKPEANVVGKDDRSFYHVVITKEDFPRVLTVRGKELEEGLPFEVSRVFGPFPHAGQFRAAMKIIRRMFPWRGEKCLPAQAGEPRRACFERQIGLCPGVCSGEITQKEYQKQIKNLILFFEGDKKKLIKRLEKEMKALAKAREFEKADAVKRQMFALYHIQDISLIKDLPARSGETSKSGLGTGSFRIESYDVAHLAGTNVVGVMTVVEDGEAKKSDYRKFKIQWFDKLTTANAARINDTKALAEIISRRLNHPEWPLPNLMVVDGGKAQKRAAEKTLGDRGFQIPVVSVVKDERHRPREILGMDQELRTMNYGRRGRDVKKYEELEREILLANAEAHRFAIGYHRSKRNRLS